ncbi:MAG: RNA polymerase sigma factor RpoH [Myxococcota bacterium]|nr:RNA polymerase sigma factor RpoH [Myxococcota bacterium]
MKGAYRSESLDLYLADINRYGLLSKEEEYELARRYRDKGDQKAAQKLVSANLRLVVRVAHKYAYYGIRLADLIQEGNMGLMKAVERFDPDKGFRFITYASWWIRVYIQNYILANVKAVRLGSKEAHRKLFFGSRETRESVTFGAHGDGPSIEMSMDAGVLPEAEKSGLANINLKSPDISLDATFDDEGRTSRLDRLESNTPDVEGHMVQSEEMGRLQGALREALKVLGERERFIVEQRLLSDEPMTLQQIGDRFGISRERARQLEKRTKDQLARQLSDFQAMA